MFNKLYEKTKRTIKENYKMIIVFLVLMLSFLVEFPYYIEAPGGIIAVNDRIKIDNKTQSLGSFNLAYVSQIKATIPTLTYALLNKDWNVIKEEEYHYEHETNEDADYRSHLLLDEANNNAIIVAFKFADKDIIISNEHLYITYVDSRADTNLKIGDEILEINNIKIINKKQLDTIIEDKVHGDILNIKVNRDNKEIDCYGKIQNMNDKKIVGVVMSKTSDLVTNPSVELEFKKSESGPSGGLTLALSIYDALVEEDITKGRKIVGTGTIDENGNVGSIGGVEYKIKGAVKEKADIFLVPTGNNYEEAKQVIEENNYNLKLISVSTFEEAIQKLK